MRQKSISYPAKQSRIKLFDYLTTVIGVASPLMTTPQIYKVWFEQNLVGVSLTSWFLLAALKIPFIVYAAVHRDYTVLTSYSLFFIMNSIVVVGIITLR